MGWWNYTSEFPEIPVYQICMVVCFRKKSQEVDYDDIQIFLDGDKIEFEEEAVFLGITIDSHLSWESHCRHVANKISRNCGAINRVKKLLQPSSLKILIWSGNLSIILSLLNWCSSLFPTRSCSPALLSDFLLELLLMMMALLMSCCSTAERCCCSGLHAPWFSGSIGQTSLWYRSINTSFSPFSFISLPIKLPLREFVPHLIE